MLIHDGLSRMIRLSDQHYPYTRRELQADHPGVSIPRNLTPEQAARLGAAHVTRLPAPTADPGMRVEQYGPELVDNVWTMLWRQVEAEPDPVPEQVYGHQMRAILRARTFGEGSLWDAVLTLVAKLPEPDRTTVDDSLRTAAVMRRDSPSVAAFQAALQLPPEYVDQIFIDAEQVRV